MTYEKPPSWWDRLYLRWLLVPVAYLVGMFITARFFDGTTATADIRTMHAGAFVFTALYLQVGKDKKVSSFTRWALLLYVFTASRWLIGWLLIVPISTIVFALTEIPEADIEPAPRLVLNVSGLVSMFIWWRVTKK